MICISSLLLLPAPKLGRRRAPSSHASELFSVKRSDSGLKQVGGDLVFCNSAGIAGLKRHCCVTWHMEGIVSSVPEDDTELVCKSV